MPASDAIGTAGLYDPCNSERNTILPDILREGTYYFVR